MSQLLYITMLLYNIQYTTQQCYYETYPRYMFIYNIYTLNWEDVFTYICI